MKNVYISYFLYFREHTKNAILINKFHCYHLYFSEISLKNLKLCKKIDEENILVSTSSNIIIIKIYRKL